MKKYKLTTQELTTYRGFKWEIGEKFTTDGIGGLCGSGFLHYYHHPLLAILLNPIHANIENPRLFEVEAEGDHRNDNWLKGGCTEMTLIKELEVPQITTTQKVAFSILLAREFYLDENYKEWSDNWLAGKDRTARAAAYAASAADAYAASAADAYAASAAYAKAPVSAAANAAYAAAYAASDKDQFFKKLVECAEKCLEY